MAVPSIVLSHGFVYHLNVVIRNEPLTGKYSYTVVDPEAGKNIDTKTQYNTWEDAAKAAGKAVTQAMTAAATRTEAKVVKDLITLKPPLQ